MDKNTLPTIIDKEKLGLVAASHDDYVNLQRWFTHKRQVLLWAGPNLPYPQNLEQFIAHLNDLSFESYSMRNQEHLVGFGQCQTHATHMHLGRLAINPCFRKQGLSYVLINKLIEEIGSKLDKPLRTVSLFVFTANKTAHKTYKNMGFIETPVPSSLKQINGCEYMLLDI